MTPGTAAPQAVSQMQAPSDYVELMATLSRPRPNGSPAETATRQALHDWLAGRGIPVHSHRFRIYPYFFECIGAWTMLSRLALAAAVWTQAGPWTLPIALAGLLGGLVDLWLRLPLVTWPGARRAENLLIEFDAPEPQQEVILSAHYDSKTEPLDHHQRMIFLRGLPLGMLLSVLLGLAGPLQAWLGTVSPGWAVVVYWGGVALSIPLLILAFGLGLNLTLGRLFPPSQGAVDNGAACAILLGLVAQLAGGEQALRRTRVTVALFTGEEVDRQGSMAYVASREWSLPARAINLEVMAQNGDYVLWEEDGSIFRRQPTDPALNGVLRGAVNRVSGSPPRAGGPILSDGAAFLAAGLPTAVLGTYDRDLGDTGFHSPQDCLERVDFARLPQGVQILAEALMELDRA